MVYVKDPWGRYLLVNARFEALFGVSREKVEGKTDHDLFSSESAMALRTNDLEVLTSGLPQEFEEVVWQKDGKHTYISLKFPIANTDGAPYAVCGISTDITQRIQSKRCLVVQHVVTQALAHSADLPDAAPNILRGLCEALDWDIGLLWTANPVTQLLGCVEVWHSAAVEFPEFERLSRELALPAGVGLAGRVLATGQAVWIRDIVVEEHLPRAAAARRDELHAGYGFPVRNGGEVLGVIELFSREARQPDPEQVRVLDGVGCQLSQFIERRDAERTLLTREKEFEVARRIQLGLLPKTAP
ncbi:MAG TPA: PAS domain-containing protein, partial [Gemmata sp.]|nr:PAS domain-containing protein [Gemmata sp.]